MIKRPAALPSLKAMPRPTSFGRDTGLQVRMVVTMFLLGAVYVALVVMLLAVGVNGAAVAIIAGGLALVNLFASDKLALAAMGARVVTPEQAPQLHAMIERLCVQADLPKPKIAVAQTVADFGERPSANALGMAVLTTAKRGFGRSACTHRRSIIACS